MPRVGPLSLACFWALFCLSFRICWGARAQNDALDIDAGEDADEQLLWMWGDIFTSASDFLWTFDISWFAIFAAFAVFLWCWQPSHLMGSSAHDGEGQKIDHDWEPEPWSATLFSSLTSHVPGIVGFVGFQKIVVARIVSASQPTVLLSPANVLLYTSILISMAATFTSLMFLAVDYLRRLAIHSAKRRYLRLKLDCGRLEATGLGILLLVLGAVALLLYLVIIYMAVRDKAFLTDAEVAQLVLKRVSSAGTVLLYLFNLRSLCASPKVQLHTMLDTSEEKTRDITLEEFLDLSAGVTARDTAGNTAGDTADEGLRSRVAHFLGFLAGEDLALFINKGSREAFFPKQRLAPLANVVCCLLFVGVLPLMIQKGMDRLFDPPGIEDVRAHPTNLFLQPESGFDFLLLVEQGKPPVLHVKTKFQQTSRVSICCPENSKNCNFREFNHSLVEFDDKQKIVDVPLKDGASTNCTLTALGLSRSARTSRQIRVESLDTFRLKTCTQDKCTCNDGYRGSWKASDGAQKLSEACQLVRCPEHSLSNKEDGGCVCQEYYVGNITWSGSTPTGTCVPAPCEIPGSNEALGKECKCKDGFMADSISWNFSRQRFQGSCTPAACNIPNSNNLGGLDCRCNNAFMGNITWNGVQPRGNCTPAPCEVQHSNGNPGLNCACLDGFSGDISWTNSTPSGSCKPAPCNVEHSNAKSGLECACSNAYVGRISWDRAVASGPCTPAPCNISNTVYDGLECRCKDGYEGKIAWNGSNAQGTCEPAKCTVPNSDTVPGPKCRCSYGYYGNITWAGSRHRGDCTQVLCSGNHVNNLNGPDCDCAPGFMRTSVDPGAPLEISTQGTYNVHFYLSCHSAPCNISNTVYDGLECRCKDGYEGKIAWNGSNAQGTCEPAKCTVPNSDTVPGP
ncbi:Jag1, partial [Symbiodinium natans]